MRGVRARAYFFPSIYSFLVLLFVDIPITINLYFIGHVRERDRQQLVWK